MSLKSILQEVFVERERQISKGRTLESDQIQDMDFEIRYKEKSPLISGAIAFCFDALGEGHLSGHIWPWEKVGRGKFVPGDSKRDSIIKAMLAAELERMDSYESTGSGTL